MVLAEELGNTELIQNLISSVSSLTLFIQAIGGLIILYIIFNLVGIIINRKNNKKFDEINKNLLEIKEILKKKH